MTIGFHNPAYKVTGTLLIFPTSTLIANQNSIHISLPLIDVISCASSRYNFLECFRKHFWNDFVDATYQADRSKILQFLSHNLLWNQCYECSTVALTRNTLIMEIMYCRDHFSTHHIWTIKKNVIVPSGQGALYLEHAITQPLISYSLNWLCSIMFSASLKIVPDLESNWSLHVSDSEVKPLVQFVDLSFYHNWFPCTHTINGQTVNIVVSPMTIGSSLKNFVFLSPFFSHKAWIFASTSLPLSLHFLQIPWLDLPTDRPHHQLIAFDLSANWLRMLCFYSPRFPWIVLLYSLILPFQIFQFGG